MNTVVIVLDSLNRHCLEPYGNTTVATPNLQRLARRSVVFDHHFVGSLPCMPARRELFTGRLEFPWRGWGHVEPWDEHLARQAADAGAVTQMITDHYHYWEQGAHGYFEPFHGAEFIRGHELDMLATDPVAEAPPWAKAIDAWRSQRGRGYQGWGTGYYANVRDWTDESRFSCAQTMSAAATWLDRNHAHPRFFLWLEAFDPHEPHFVPEPYRSMYAPGVDASRLNCWPPYQDPKRCTEFLAQAGDAELAWIRAQYYGKVTMVDHWLGRVLDALDRHNLWANTAIVLTTDHGHDLCYDRALHPIPWAKQYPHPESHARIPLLIYHPSFPAQGRRVSALTAAVDVNATVRDLLDCRAAAPHGRSLLPLIRGETEQHRDWVLYGTFGTGAVLSTPEWTLAQGLNGSEPLHWYSTTALRVAPTMTAGHFIPGVNVPQWRVPCGRPTSGNYLWDRSRFSLTPENVLSRHPEIAASMRGKLRSALDQITCPPELPRLLGL